MASHPYLAASLIMVMLFLVGLSLSPRQRGPALLCGLLTVPHALLVPLFVPEYWNPRCIATIHHISPEDVIYLFAHGGITWLVSTWPMRHRIVIHVVLFRLLKRYAAIEGFAVAMHLSCWWFGLGAMTSHMATMAVKALVLLWLRGELWMIPVAGGIGYTGFTLICLPLACALCPHFPSLWNAEGIWGPRLGGVPLEEFLWAFLAGAVTPFSMAYTAGAGIEPNGGATRS